jgi:hypothetical protein
MAPQFTQEPSMRAKRVSIVVGSIFAFGCASLIFNVATSGSIHAQGDAFLDGYDHAGSREHGNGYLLDRLGLSGDELQDMPIVL